MKATLIKILSLIITFVFFAEIKAQDSSFVVHKINVQGNKTTKSSIILRELLFKENDTIPYSEWIVLKEKCRDNLFNTSLFLTVVMDTALVDGYTNVNISVMERWYIFPFPVFEVDERNFNAWWDSDRLSRASGGLFFFHRNFRGRMENLQILFEIGYNKVLGFSYSAPYINKKKTIGLSIQSVYSLRHEVNNTSLDNKQDYLKLNDKPIQRKLNSYAELTWRPNIYGTYLFHIGHDKFLFADTLLQVSPNYSYKGLVDFSYFNIMFRVKNDHRDYKSYPLEGHYEDAEIWKYGDGFGLIENNNLNIIQLKTSLRWYKKLSKNLFYAIGFAGKLSNNTIQPFVIEEGLGYTRDFVRGYENYVMDGQHYAVFKHNIKYNLIKTRFIHLRFLHSKKFNNIPFTLYTNVFNDAGYCKNTQNYPPSNTFVNRWLYSTGIGFDIVSYYDGIMRFEYTLNHKKEAGFYLHMIAPI